MIALLIVFFFFYLIWFFILKKDKSELENTPPVTLPKYFSLSLAAAITGFNVFLYGTFDAITLPTFGLAMANIFWVISLGLSYRKSKNPLFWSLMTVSVLSSLFLIWRDNGFVHSVNVSSMIITTLLLLMLHTYKAIYWKGFWLLNQTIKLVPFWVHQSFHIFKKQKTHTDRPNHKQTIITIFKTVSITAVVLIFFSVLLSQADPIFAQLIKDIQEEAIGRTILSLCIGFILLVLFSLSRSASEDDQISFRWLGFNDLFIPILAVVILFGVFLGVQAQYLFGSHQDLASFGLTYSEYVRKGFTELLVTTFFGSFIVYLAIIRKQTFSNSLKRKELGFVTALMIIELFLMLASALKRDFMYVEVYGLTRVRIVGGLFLVWLAGVLSILMVMVMKKIKEVRLFQSVFLLSCGVWLALNIINIDQIVVHGSPAHHDYKDYFYINNLSSDGVNGWLQSINELETNTNQLLEKDHLSDIEKSRLAGNKLALISLLEQKQYLILKYQDEETIIKHCKQLNCGDYLDYRDYQDHPRPVKKEPSNSDNDQDQPKGLPYQVKQYRKWQFFNWSEYQAFKKVLANIEQFNQNVPSLLNKIETYQIDHNLSLYQQEDRLLNEFTYPFIEIDLDYYPQRITTISNPRDFGDSFSEFQIEKMSQDDGKLQSLVLDACSDESNKIITIHGMIKKKYTDDSSLSLTSNESFIFWDDSSILTTTVYTDPQLQGTIPDNDLISEDIKEDEEKVAPQTTSLGQATENNAVFIKGEFEVSYSEVLGCELRLKKWAAIPQLR